MAARVRNSSNVSGAAAAQTLTIAAVVGQRVQLWELSGFTSGGTSQVIVYDGTTANTVIWRSPATWLTTTLVTKAFARALETTSGNAMTITTSSAGGADTVTLNIEADQLGG